MHEEDAVVVAVRFSLWRPEFARLTRRQFYSEERLAEKFFLFRNVTCRCMDLQSDRDFLFVAFVDDNLPRKHMQGLQGIKTVIPIPVRTYEDITTNMCLTSILKPGTRRIALVRLDDDDGLHPHFIRKLKLVLARHQHSDRFAIDFPSGLEVHARREAERAVIYSIKPAYYTHAAQGLASVSGRQDRNAYFCRHGHIEEEFPVVSVPDFHPAYVRTLMEHNNSLLRHKRKKPAANASLELSRQALELLFSGHFH